MGKSAGLSRLQRLFIECYLDCFDVGEAARRCGCQVQGDTSIQITRAYNRVGRRLLRNPLVGLEVEKRLTGALRSIGVEKGKILNELCSLAFFDPDKLFDTDGSPLALAEVDSATRACIVGLEVEERYEGTGLDRRFAGYIRKYKIIPKTEPLKLLGSHLGLFADGVPPQKDRLQEIVDALRFADPVTDPGKLLEGQGRIIDSSE